MAEKTEMNNTVKKKIFRGTFPKDHVLAVDKSVKEAFKLRPSFFANELCKAELAKYKAKFGEI